MILLLNECNKSIRYADRFKSFDKFLNKLLEDKQYKYIDLIDLGIELNLEKSNKYIDGSEIRFYLIEMLLKETIPNIIKEKTIPILELKPLIDAIDGFCVEKQFYLKMLLNNFHKCCVFCGSAYEYEHFSSNLEYDFSGIKQFLYDGETSFFTDVYETINNEKNNEFEATIASIDGFGFFLPMLKEIDKTKIVQLSGNSGSKISFDEILKWIIDNRCAAIENVLNEQTSVEKFNIVPINLIIENLMKNSAVTFVRKHHPIELFLK